MVFEVLSISVLVICRLISVFVFTQSMSLLKIKEQNFSLSYLRESNYYKRSYLGKPTLLLCLHIDIETKSNSLWSNFRDIGYSTMHK